jgi:hypothetical protein
MRRRQTSWLDQMVYRFQHRWETSPQYRGAVAGVSGLILIVLMCSCTGVLATVANAGLGSLGGGGTGNSSNTGTKQLGSQKSFPTATIPPYTVATIPSGNIPDSQTPGPTPTGTHCQSGCGGGGGGRGGGENVTGSASPTPWMHGQAGVVNVHTSQPNVGITILASFPDGSSQTNNGSGMTDGNGNYSWSLTSGVPSDCTSGRVHIAIEAGFNGGGSMKSITIYQSCR